MPTRNYKPEQIVGVLRKIEVQMASGHAAGVAGEDPRGVGRRSRRAEGSGVGEKIELNRGTTPCPTTT